MSYQITAKMSVSAGHSLDAFTHLGFSVHFFDRLLAEYVDDVDEASRSAMERENAQLLREHGNSPDNLRYVIELYRSYDNFGAALLDIRTVQKNVHVLSFQLSSVD